MQKITLDLVPGKKMPSLHASQFDDGRAYHVDLTENRVPYTLDGTETISVIIRKCDNTLVSMDIANTFADKSYIEFEVVEQMTACAGFNYGEIILEKNGDRLGSLNFYLQVEAAPDEGGVQSKDGIYNLKRQVNELVAEDLADNGAEQTGYDNTKSGLEATNVQDAIDEVNAKIENIPSVDAYTKEEANDKFATKTALNNLSDEVDDKASIDDTSTASDKAWSAEKVNTALSGKANTADVTELQSILQLAIDESTFTDGKYIGTDGKAYNHSDYKISPYVKCELSNIKFNCLTATNTISSIAFYRSTNELSFIEGYSNTASLSTFPTHTMEVPTDTHYIRITKQKTSFYTGNVAPYVMSVERYEVLTERLISAEETATEAKEIAESGSVDTIYRLVKKDINLIPSGNLILHSYLNDSGEVKTITNPSSVDYVKCVSDYIPVEEGRTLYMSADDFIYWRYFGWYDANKDYLGGKDDYGAMNYKNHVSNVVVPTNAHYLRVTFLTVEDAGQAWADYTGATPTGEVIFASDIEHLDYHYFPTNPCDFNGNDISVFNKIACIGDSITEGYFNKADGSSGTVKTQYAYPVFLEKLTGVDCTNLGNSGATSVDWWSTHSTDDFSGYDCAIINLGINDALQSISEADTRSAFANIINALKTANVGIKIFVANVNPAYSRGVTTYDTINAIIEDIAENTEDCYFIDLTEYGHAVGASYVNGHLTACGYRQLAEDYKNNISYIVRNNPEAFRFVQFIGTNLYPTT